MDFTGKCVDAATELPLSVMHHISCFLHFVPTSRLSGCGWVGGFHLPRIATTKRVYHSAESQSRLFQGPPPPLRAAQERLRFRMFTNAAQEAEITGTDRLIKKDPRRDNSLSL